MMRDASMSVPGPSSKPKSTPIARATRLMTSPSVMQPGGGLTVWRTRWMRRSELREGAVLLEEGGARQHDVRVLRRLAHEDVLHDEELELLERADDVRRVRIRLRDVLAEDVHRLERARVRGVEHVGMTQALVGRRLDTPHAAVIRPRDRIGDVAVVAE
jgi:hypothetical protein